MTRIIVSIDGNVNTGKTTLFNDLKKEHSSYSFSEEYSNVHEEDDLERQVLFLMQDRFRVGRNARNVIVDRSILSLSAYTYWLYKCGKNDIRTVFYDRLIDELENKTLELPNKVIVCRQNYLKIWEAYLGNKNIKDTDSDLVNEQYIDTQNNFYKRFNEAIGNRVFFYSYLSEVHVADIVEMCDVISKTDFIIALQYAMEINNEPALISINGTSAVGKSSLCNFFEQDGYLIVDEVRLEIDSYDKDEMLTHQVRYFEESVKRYFVDGKNVVDNGIFETISYTFYLAASNGYGMEFLDNYFDKILLRCPSIRINQTFYLQADCNEIVKRKENDKKKRRKHFESNFKTNFGERKLAELLNRIVNNRLFVVIDANKRKETIYEEMLSKIRFRSIDLLQLITQIYEQREYIYQFYSYSKHGGE